MSRGPEGRTEDPLQSLPLWNRFHIRLTGVYAVAVVIVLGLNSALFYAYGVDRELAAVQNQLMATAVTLSQTVEGERLVDLRGKEAMSEAAYVKVHKHLEAVSAHFPAISSMYILLLTEEEGQLRFAMDLTVGGEDVVPGEAYDAREIPMMLKGIHTPTVESQVVRDEYGSTLSGYAPLLDGEGRSLGVIGIDVDASQVEHIKHRVLLFSLSLLGLTALLLFVAAWVNGRRVRNPLSRVIYASDAVAHGDFGVRLEMDRSDEFGLLGDQFNEMAKDLGEREVIRETLGRYVSEDVAAAALSGGDALELGGEEREVTILFSDLRGYSTLSEVLSPTEIVTFLNAYLGGMNDVIDGHLGCVIEYLGDAILAVFGAPNDMDGHAGQAVACALAMRERFAELNEEWDKDGFSDLWRSHGLDALSARIGIHTGRVVAGNLGSHSRMKYAVIGDTVNIAARLEQLNKELSTDILVSQAVYDQLPSELRDRGKDMGHHRVKGRQQEVPVYCMAR